MTRLKIEGMSCGHCKASVEKALAGVDGVSAVKEVDLKSGEAVVEGDASPKALIAAVEGAGYEARAV